MVPWFRYVTTHTTPLPAHRKAKPANEEANRPES